MTQLPTFVLIATFSSVFAVHNDTDPPPDWCSDAACCKKNARNKRDAQVCDDFYNPSIGLSYTMFTSNGWLREAAWPITDSVFNKKPPSKRLPDNQQQCMSISYSGRRACPYPGAGAWGVALSIDSDSNFWEYFQQSPSGELCGQCRDGFKCGFPARNPLTKDWTYQKFLNAKNAIMGQTGTPACSLPESTAYNEFDTNGLSSTALVGVFIPKCLERLDAPSTAAVCKTLTNNGGMGHWPVFVYDNGGMRQYQGTSSLRIDRYMFCVFEDTDNATISV